MEKPPREGSFREHILVCLSSAPSNARIVRTAAKMASALNASFTALYVQTARAEKADETDKKRLACHIRLAESYGATVATVYGEDVAARIAEYARLSGATTVVIGRSATGKRFGRPSLTDSLIACAPDLDIHIIPDGSAPLREPKKPSTGRKVLPAWEDCLIAVLVLLAATALGFLFSFLGFSEANIITVYILGVLVTSAVTDSPVCWATSAVAGVFLFNFLFTEPQYTLLAYDKGYPVTFVIMLAASLLTGSLAGKLKRHARQTARAAYRTKVLFETNQRLETARSDAAIALVTAEQLKKLLSESVTLYLYDGKKLSEPQKALFGEQESDAPNADTIALWTAQNARPAGSTTGVFAENPLLYLPVRAGETVYGVAAFAAPASSADSFENGVIQSILGECALALENSRNAAKREQAAILAENERLRANLLRSISHDLRTPLTSISGNASNLIYNGETFDENTKKQIYTDIYNDSMWLVNLVENLLSITRIEEGKMQLNMSAELIDEVLEEAVRRVERYKGSREIRTECRGEWLLCRMDARLIVQVVVNLLDNAIKYTPEESRVAVTAERKEENIVVSVADDGDGIPDEKKERVFDMFYTGGGKIADGRRSLGLGLYLCRSIVRAHGGDLTVGDNAPRGAVFSFTLPATEVERRE